MLDKLATATRQHATKHALALAQANIFAFLVLDINIESIALEEELQVAVVLKNGMRGYPVEHAFQGGTS
jgi:hypothetical protein